MSFHAPIDPAVFDGDLLAGVQRLIAPDRLQSFLEVLDRQLAQIVQSRPGQPGLEQQAHKIVSQAGMLGLNRMCDSARALEEACRSGADSGAALRRCAESVGDIRQYAMPAMEHWPEALATSPGELPAAA